MKRAGILTALIALAACSQKDPPPAPMARPVMPAPPAPKLPEPNPPTDCPPSPPPAPPVVRVESPRPQEPAPPAARRPFSNGNVHLPAFTFRALEGGGRVLINGEELSAGVPCLWSITDDIEFDPKIPVPSWPPDDAVVIGSTSHEESGSADLYMARASTLAHLQPNEIVLYVKGRVGRRTLQGGLRLLVEGCRYTDYTPLVNPEGDAASKFLRTIWFEPARKD